MKSICIRGGSGLGDAIYVAGVARHFIEKGHPVEVCTGWPDVFRYMDCKVSPFKRTAGTIAHYVQRKGAKGTSQFDDACIRAGITERIDFQFDWHPTDHDLVANVRDTGLPVIAVSLPRNPMNRADRFGGELLPDCARLQQAIDQLRGRAKIVQVGSGKPRFSLTGLDEDFANRTTVAGLLDIIYAADGLLGYCSFFVPLADALPRPGMFVWSRRGLNSGHSYISQITPEKVLHRKTHEWVIDDCSDTDLNDTVEAFLEQVRGQQQVRRQVGGNRRLCAELHA